MRVMVCGFVGMLLALAPGAHAQAGKALPATDITSADVQTFLNHLPKDIVSDSPIRVVDVGGHRVGIFGVFRPKSMPSDALIHETTTTEVYYMLEGMATLVTGGTPANPKPSPSAAETTTKRFASITDGVTRHVGPGDIIIIPGRTPHWWSNLDGDHIRYLIVRSDPDGSFLTVK
jgi:mannose-6-phosphate isomerase-like protein (cupin superfamily)